MPFSSKGSRRGKQRDKEMPLTSALLYANIKWRTHGPVPLRWKRRQKETFSTELFTEISSCLLHGSFFRDFSLFSQNKFATIKTWQKHGQEKRKCLPATALKDLKIFLLGFRQSFLLLPRERWEQSSVLQVPAPDKGGQPRLLVPPPCIRDSRTAGPLLNGTSP